MSSLDGAGVAPLDGITVIDLTQILAGPYCTRLLADAGATVIKVEPPTGDPSRHLPPTFAGDHSGYFANLNTGKLSVQVNLRTPEGVNQIKSLVAAADVVVENMRPGALARKGLGYDNLAAINPRLIMASISAFGNTGEFADRPGQGIIAEAYSGAIDMTGMVDGPPLPMGISLADVSAGIHAYAAIVTALYRRDRGDDVGEYIDVSLFDASLPFQETAFLEVAVGDGTVDPTRQGSEHRSVVPYGVYRAGDGYLAIAAGTDALWQRLQSLLSGDSELPADLSTNDKRVSQRDLVRRMIETWAAAAGGAGPALDQLQRAGIPAAPVRKIREVATTEPALSRGSFATVPDPERGTISVVNTPFRMSRSIMRPSRAAPRLGEHTTKIIAAQ